MAKDLKVRSGDRIKSASGCSGCKRRKEASQLKAPTQDASVPAKTVAQAPEKKYIEIQPERNSYLKYNVDGINYGKVYIESAFGRVSVAAFMAELEAWKRARYDHMGQTKQGTDCIGLVLGVYKALGMIPKDLMPSEYPKQWYLEDDIQTHPAFNQIKASVPMLRIDNPEDFLPGDVIIFKFGKATEAHCGLRTVRGTIIHAVAGQVDKGYVIESRLDDNTWKDKIAYAYRLVKDKV